MAGWHSLSGYLTYKPGGALGRLKSRKRLWYTFEESQCQLLYYKSEANSIQHPPIGHIDIHNAAISLDLVQQNQFIIISTDGKDHALAADNHESLMIWLIGLQAKRDAYLKKPVVTVVSEGSPDCKPKRQRSISDGAALRLNQEDRARLKAGLLQRSATVKTCHESAKSTASSRYYGRRRESCVAAPQINNNTLSCNRYGRHRESCEAVIQMNNNTLIARPKPVAASVLSPVSEARETSTESGAGHGKSVIPDGDSKDVARTKSTKALLQRTKTVQSSPFWRFKKTSDTSSESSPNDNVLSERNIKLDAKNYDTKPLAPISSNIPNVEQNVNCDTPSSDEGEQNDNRRVTRNIKNMFKCIKESLSIGGEVVETVNNESDVTMTGDVHAVADPESRAGDGEEEIEAEIGADIAACQAGRLSSLSGHSESTDSAIDRASESSTEAGLRMVELEKELIDSKCELAKAMNQQTCYQEALLRKDTIILEMDLALDKAGLIEGRNTNDKGSKKSWVVNENKGLNEKVRTLQNENRFLNEEVRRLAKLRQQERECVSEQEKRLSERDSVIDSWKRDYVSVIQSCIHFPSGDTMDGAEVTLYREDKHKLRVQQLLDEARLINPSLPTYERLVTNEVHVDQYGFKHHHDDAGLLLHYICQQLGQHYTQQLANHEVHQKAWKTYICEHREFNIMDKELKLLCRAGIPNQYRKEVWKKLVHNKVKDMMEEKGPFYFRNLCNSLPESQIAAHYRKQISLDLMRTMPGNVKFCTPASKGVRDLQDVLLALCIHNPSIGYCQGLNFLVAVCLLIMDAQDAFWTLVAITERYFSPDYFDHNLIGAQADQEVLKEIMREKFPSLFQHFDDMDIEISTVTLNWFLAIFFDAVPFETLLRIWDCFFLEGPKVLFRFSLAMFKLHETELVRKMDTISVMKHIKSCAKLNYDADGLIKTAFEDLEPFPRRQSMATKQAWCLTVLKEMMTKRAMDTCQETEQMMVEKEKEQSYQDMIDCAVAYHDGRLWLAHGDSGQSKLCKVNCCQNIMYYLPIQFDARILCLEFLDETTVLIGTISWMLFAYNTKSRQKMWEVQLHDAVMSLSWIQEENSLRVFAALADGTIAVIEDVMKADTGLEIFFLPVGKSPVSTVIVLNSQLWCACANIISILHARTLDLMDSFSISANPYNQILSLTPGNYGIWVSVKGSSVLELWDCYTLTCKMIYDTKSGHYPHLKKEDDIYFNQSRITSVLAYENTVWVGTGEGTLNIYEINDHTPPESIHDLSSGTESLGSSPRFPMFPQRSRVSTLVDNIEEKVARMYDSSTPTENCSDMFPFSEPHTERLTEVVLVKADVHNFETDEFHTDVQKESEREGLFNILTKTRAMLNKMVTKHDSNDNQTTEISEITSDISNNSSAVTLPDESSNDGEINFTNSELNLSIETDFELGSESREKTPVPEINSSTVSEELSVLEHTELCKLSDNVCCCQVDRTVSDFLRDSQDNSVQSHDYNIDDHMSHDYNTDDHIDREFSNVTNDSVFNSCTVSSFTEVTNDSIDNSMCHSVGICSAHSHGNGVSISSECTNKAIHVYSCDPSDSTEYSGHSYTQCSTCSESISLTGITACIDNHSNSTASYVAPVDLGDSIISCSSCNLSNESCSCHYNYTDLVMDDHRCNPIDYHSYGSVTDHTYSSLCNHSNTSTDHTCSFVRNHSDTSTDHTCSFVSNHSDTSTNHTCSFVRSHSDTSTDHTCDFVHNHSNTSTDHTCSFVHNHSDTSTNHTCDFVHNRSNTSTDHTCDFVLNHRDTSDNCHSNRVTTPLTCKCCGLLSNDCSNNTYYHGDEMDNTEYNETESINASCDFNLHDDHDVEKISTSFTNQSTDLFQQSRCGSSHEEVCAKILSVHNGGVTPSNQLGNALADPSPLLIYNSAEINPQRRTELLMLERDQDSLDRFERLERLVTTCGSTPRLMRLMMTCDSVHAQFSDSCSSDELIPQNDGKTDLTRSIVETSDDVMNLCNVVAVCDVISNNDVTDTCIDKEFKMATDCEACDDRNSVIGTPKSCAMDSGQSSHLSSKLNFVASHENSHEFTVEVNDSKLHSFTESKAECVSEVTMNQLIADIACIHVAAKVKEDSNNNQSLYEDYRRLEESSKVTLLRGYDDALRRGTSLCADCSKQAGNDFCDVENDFENVPKTDKNKNVIDNGVSNNFSEHSVSDTLSHNITSDCVLNVRPKDLHLLKDQCDADHDRELNTSLQLFAENVSECAHDIMINTEYCFEMLEKTGHNVNNSEFMVNSSALETASEITNPQYFCDDKQAEVISVTDFHKSDSVSEDDVFLHDDSHILPVTLCKDAMDDPETFTIPAHWNLIDSYHGFPESIEMKRKSSEMSTVVDKERSKTQSRKSNIGRAKNRDPEIHYHLEFSDIQVLTDPSCTTTPSDFTSSILDTSRDSIGEESISPISYNMDPGWSENMSSVFSNCIMDVIDPSSDQSESGTLPPITVLPPSNLDISPTKSHAWSSYDEVSTPSRCGEYESSSDLKDCLHVNKRMISHTSSNVSLSSMTGEHIYQVDLTLQTKVKVADKPLKCLSLSSCNAEPIIISCAGCYGDDEAVLRWSRQENEKIWTNEPIYELCPITKQARLPSYMRGRISSTSSVRSSADSITSGNSVLDAQSGVSR